MATPVKRAALTYQDYLQLPDDGLRYEIIEGELHVSPAPSMKHQWTATQLTAVLGVHVYDNDLGHVCSAPTDVYLADGSIVQPDVLFISRDRLHIVTDPNVRGAPDLVVEIIAPSSMTTDQETKCDLYAKHGVKHCWVFEPVAQWVRAFELGADGAYELVAEAAGDASFSAPPFAGLAIPLARLWGV
ncbi:MAG: Uma2 family endonuclease [Chloroflexi bacterium]|nr:Uma2 family endonuclease [Chloroflexota bacterium]